MACEWQGNKQYHIDALGTGGCWQHDTMLRKDPLSVFKLIRMF